MYHLLRLVTKAAPNSVCRTVGGLHRVNWDNPFTGGEALKEPSHAGGQSVTSTLALSVLKDKEFRGIWQVTVWLE